jgi:hypothetical protein
MILCALSCDSRSVPEAQVAPSTEPSNDRADNPIPDLPIPTPDDKTPVGRAANDPPLPSWPNDLRLLDARRTTAREHPVVLLRFEVPAATPEAAARRVITVLSQSNPEARTVVSVSPDQASATAQLRSKQLLAALRAWTENGLVMVELLAERP